MGAPGKVSGGDDEGIPCGSPPAAAADDDDDDDDDDGDGGDGDGGDGENKISWSKHFEILSIISRNTVLSLCCCMSLSSPCIGSTSR